MDIVLTLHLLVRCLVLLAAIIGLVKSLIALSGKNWAENADPMLTTIFLGVFDLQAFLGILLIFLGRLQRPLHPLVMLIALGVAHGLATLVKRDARANVQWLRVALYAAPLAIVLFGLLIIDKLRI